MTNDILIFSDTPIVWADTTDYAGDLGSRTAQIDLTGLVAGAAWQGDQVDLGAVRPELYAVTIAIEMAVAPAASQVVSLHWAPSPHATAATANPGGIVGADGTYIGTAGDSLADSILQLIPILVMPLTTDATTVVQFYTKMFAPEHRYGTPVVYNEEATQAFVADAVEMGISFTPVIPQVQDAP